MGVNEATLRFDLDFLKKKERREEVRRKVRQGGRRKGGKERPSHTIFHAQSDNVLLMLFLRETFQNKLLA